MYTHTDREHPHTKHGQTIARIHAPCMHVQTSSNTVYSLKYGSKTLKRYSSILKHVQTVLKPHVQIHMETYTIHIYIFDISQCNKCVQKCAAAASQ